MGISQKSHGKKTDKETQSPMLKIFKDIMQKDKCDPEKTTLLKEKHERKRRHYSGSRSKSGHKTIESSSSEKMKKSSYKTDIEVDNSRSQSLPFQGDKRENYWFWRDTELKDNDKLDPDDTCSRVSCALKKLISTDYACVACLVVLFAVSVIAALLLLYKSVPCATSVGDNKLQKVMPQKPEIDRLKRKTESKWNFADTNPWDSKDAGSYSGNFGNFDLRETSRVSGTGDDLTERRRHMFVMTS